MVAGQVIFKFSVYIIYNVYIYIYIYIYIGINSPMLPSNFFFFFSLIFFLSVCPRNESATKN